MVLESRKIRRQKALDSGLCGLCFRRPIYWERSEKKCKHCFDVFVKCQADWLLQNPHKRKEYSKSYYDKNASKLIQKQKDLRKTPEFKEYYKKYYSDTQEYQKTRNKIYAETHRDKMRTKARVHARRTRDRKNNNGVGYDMFTRLSVSDWNSVLSVFGNRCLKCGTDQKIQIDHIVPLSLGGHHAKYNVQPLCSDCNNRKQTKIMDYRPQYFLDWT